jgi:hypothetical protein
LSIDKDRPSTTAVHPATTSIAPAQAIAALSEQIAVRLRTPWHRRGFCPWFIMTNPHPDRLHGSSKGFSF